MLCVWQDIHLKEMLKETIKDSNLGESMTLSPVWQGIHLQKTSKETHAGENQYQRDLCGDIFIS